MTQITRRGLLGIFAAGASAAILPSGIIMPLRKIIVPTGFWQDFARTIPAHPGDPVAVADTMMVVNGEFQPMYAGSVEARPRMVRGQRGEMGVMVSPDHWMKSTVPTKAISAFYVGSRSVPPLLTSFEMYSASVDFGGRRGSR